MIRMTIKQPGWLMESIRPGFWNVAKKVGWYLGTEVTLRSWCLNRKVSGFISGNIPNSSIYIYMLCIQVVGNLSSQYYVPGFNDLLDTITVDEFCLINGGKWCMVNILNGTSLPTFTAQPIEWIGLDKALINPSSSLHWHHSATVNLRSRFKYCLFSPRKLGFHDPIWLADFSNGLVQPTTRNSLFFDPGIPSIIQARHGPATMRRLPL